MIDDQTIRRSRPHASNSVVIPLFGFPGGVAEPISKLTGIPVVAIRVHLDPRYKQEQDKGDSPNRLPCNQRLRVPEVVAVDACSLPFSRS